MTNLHLLEPTLSDPLVKLCRRFLAPTGIGRTLLAATFVCLTMPTTVHAQTEPEATGTVTCNVTHQDAGTAGTTEVIVTPIKLSALGGVFPNRWGPGRDANYVFSGFSGRSGEGDRNFSEHFYSVPYPNNLSAEEQEYSETGKLDYKISKGNTLTISGTSFVSMWYSWSASSLYPASSLYLVGQCTWKLSGTGTLF